jgi:hypothetical protein
VLAVLVQRSDEWHCVRWPVYIPQTRMWLCAGAGATPQRRLFAPWRTSSDQDCNEKEAGVSNSGHCTVLYGGRRNINLCPECNWSDAVALWQLYALLAWSVIYLTTGVWEFPSLLDWQCGQSTGVAMQIGVRYDRMWYVQVIY